MRDGLKENSHKAAKAKFLQKSSIKHLEKKWTRKSTSSMEITGVSQTSVEMDTIVF